MEEWWEKREQVMKHQKQLWKGFKVSDNGAHALVQLYMC